MKRWLDLALAAPALAAAAPLVAGLALAVRLTSPGPAFFVQTRLGRHRRPIRVVKLRTMTEGAEHGGAQVTAAQDPRVTPLGRFLRATKLDELPQLWNVVRGDMSLTGPRPEVERYVKHYRPEWERVFDVRPGLTDSASVAFRHEEELLAGAHDRERAYVEVLLPLKIRLALEDVERASLAHDLGVLLRTALAVLGANPTHPAVVEARRALADG
jgi:lipopolysaccharide/colanic/teichoic acid biosynthesis glycosyltransferase